MLKIPSRIKRIAVLTPQGSWFVPKARKFVQDLQRQYPGTRLFFEYERIPAGYDVIFILSYTRIIGPVLLKRHKHNIVVHASDLPKGTGWAPLFWQVLEGKRKVVFTLFEADEKADTGTYYIKSSLRLKGTELHDELRELQAQKCFELCRHFLNRYDSLRPRVQKGVRTFLKRRTPTDSRLDPRKTLRKQFNLLRICSNDDFPAFFYLNGRKYILKIYSDQELQAHGKK
ncbi:MAG: formyltransferase family protein [Candidatus Omnitrophota bacterium]